MITNFNMITGSWYASGFHGHFRSKSRNDVLNQYREHAKPSPPTKFIDRAKVRSNHHLFSRHDNRNSHSTNMGDLETHFNMGMGKRKAISSQHSKNTHDLLKWNDNQPIHQSSYRNNYSNPNPMQKYQVNNEPRCQNLNYNILNYSINQPFKPTDCSTVTTVKRFHKRSFSAPQRTAVVEPVHVRNNLILQRRMLTAKLTTTECNQRSPPLLAWTDNTDTAYHKPCIGNSLKRNINKVNKDIQRGISLAQLEQRTSLF